MTKFKYAFDNKRYHTWNYYLRNTFGEKVFKVSINAGFSCPNIDGTVAYGGCTYCSKEGSGDLDIILGIIILEIHLAKKYSKYL